MSSPSDLTSFLNNPRKLQELAMRPIADSLYARVFPSMVSVKRHDHDDKHILDREHGIDAYIQFDNQQLVTLQEKFLSHKYSRYQSLTVEYEQNQFTHEMGDWIKLACQLYFVGYANEEQTAFSSYVLVDFVRLVLETQKGKVNWQQNKNSLTQARASFKFVRFKDIPPVCVIMAMF